jgi:hypothetical protein
MSSPLNLESRLVAVSRQVHRDVAGETMILGLAKSRYYSLNETGSRIWGLLQQPIIAAAIADVVSAEQEAPRERIEADLMALLAQLLDEGLIEVASV